METSNSNPPSLAAADSSKSLAVNLEFEEAVSAALHRDFCGGKALCMESAPDLASSPLRRGLSTFTVPKLQDRPFIEVSSIDGLEGACTLFPPEPPQLKSLRTIGVPTPTHSIPNSPARSLDPNFDLELLKDPPEMPLLSHEIFGSMQTQLVSPASSHQDDVESDSLLPRVTSELGVIKSEASSVFDQLEPADGTIIYSPAILAAKISLSATSEGIPMMHEHPCQDSDVSVASGDVSLPSNSPAFERAMHILAGESKLVQPSPNQVGLANQPESGSGDGSSPSTFNDESSHLQNVLQNAQNMHEEDGTESTVSDADSFSSSSSFAKASGLQLDFSFGDTAFDIPPRDIPPRNEGTLAAIPSQGLLSTASDHSDAESLRESLNDSMTSPGSATPDHPSTPIESCSVPRLFSQVTGTTVTVIQHPVVGKSNPMSERRLFALVARARLLAKADPELEKIRVSAETLVRKGSSGSKSIELPWPVPIVETPVVETPIVESPIVESPKVVDVRSRSPIPAADSGSPYTKEKKLAIAEFERWRNMTEAKKMFNVSPGHGIKCLVDTGIIPDPDDKPSHLTVQAHREMCAQSLARILWSEPGFSKPNLGRLLGQDNPFIRRVVSAYMHLMPFEGRNLEASLRALFGKVAPPNDWHATEHIVHAFATEWYVQNLVRIQNTMADVPSTSSSRASLSRFSGAVRRSLGRPVSLLETAQVDPRAFAPFQKPPTLTHSPQSGSALLPPSVSGTAAPVGYNEWWFNAITARSIAVAMLRFDCDVHSQNAVQHMSARKIRSSLTQELVLEISRGGVRPDKEQSNPSDIKKDPSLMAYLKALFSSLAQSPLTGDPDQEKIALYDYLEAQDRLLRQKEKVVYHTSVFETDVGLRGDHGIREFVPVSVEYPVVHSSLPSTNGYQTLPNANAYGPSRHSYTDGAAVPMRPVSFTPPPQVQVCRPVSESENIRNAVGARWKKIKQNLSISK